MNINNDAFGGFIVSKEIIDNGAPIYNIYRIEPKQPGLNGWAILSKKSFDNFGNTDLQLEAVYTAQSLFSVQPIMFELFDAPFGTDVVFLYPQDNTEIPIGFWDLNKDCEIDFDQILHPDSSENNKQGSNENDLNNLIVKIQYEFQRIIRMYTPFPCEKVVYAINIFNDIDNPDVLIDGSFCMFKGSHKWQNIDDMLAENMRNQLRETMQSLYMQWRLANIELGEEVPTSIICVLHKDSDEFEIIFDYAPVYTKEAYDAGISPFDYNNYLRYKYMDIQPSNEIEREGIDKIENL